MNTSRAAEKFALASLLEEANAFFEDPQNQKDFQVWLQKRRQETNDNDNHS